VEIFTQTVVAQCRAAAGRPLIQRLGLEALINATVRIV
jgi:hypothetical protein